MATLPQKLREHSTYLSSPQAISASAAPVDQAKAVKDTFEAMLVDIQRAPGINAAEAIQCIACLQDTPLESHQRMELAKAVHVKKHGSRQVNQSGKSKQASQNCFYFQRFLGPQHWEGIRSDMSWPRLQMFVIDILDEFGLSNPSEKMWTHLVAILEVARSRDDRLAVDPRDFYRKKEDLKATAGSIFKMKQSHHGMVIRHVCNKLNFHLNGLLL